jgi:hypothetical protein
MRGWYWGGGERVSGTVKDNGGIHFTSSSHIVHPCLRRPIIHLFDMSSVFFLHKEKKLGAVISLHSLDVIYHRQNQSLEKTQIPCNDILWLQRSCRLRYTSAKVFLDIEVGLEWTDEFEGY